MGVILIHTLKNVKRFFKNLENKKVPDISRTSMRKMGVEPTRCHHRQILSLLRLPFRHFRRHITEIIMQFLSNKIIIS